MRLPRLGGTVFPGRARTDAALARGHACDREAVPFLAGLYGPKDPLTMGEPVDTCRASVRARDAVKA